MLEKTLESSLDCEEIQPVNSKGDKFWIFIEGLMLKLKLSILWCEELTHWKSPWCWERLKAGREGDNRRWDGWMASLTQWTWVWVISGSWLWTGKPSVLQSTASQRVRHDWVIELDWWKISVLLFYFGFIFYYLKYSQFGFPCSLLHNPW